MFILRFRLRQFGLHDFTAQLQPHRARLAVRAVGRDPDVRRVGEHVARGFDLPELREERRVALVLRQQLRELGYVEGQNVAFEARFASGKLERLPALAQELVRLNVAVIVTGGTAAALDALSGPPARFQLSWRVVPIM